MVFSGLFSRASARRIIFECTLVSERRSTFPNKHFTTLLRKFVTGLFFTLLSALRLRKLSLYLEDQWGGRVGVLSPPMPRETDPFVLLAHHRHSFWPLDPIRHALKYVLPEGFPAHAHRGFQTVTYVMQVRVGEWWTVNGIVFAYCK